MPDSTMVDPSAWAGIASQAPHFLVTNGTKLIAAILIYIIGKWIARMVSNLMRKMMTHSKVDASLVSFAGNLTYAVILVFVIIAAIGKLGVQTTSFIALIGAAGLAVGMALQGSLSNFAAGVMLILFKPFKVGDTITGAGMTGKVHDIGIFHCIILTSDNRKLIIPNAKLSADSITNFSSMPTRRIELTVAVPGTSDISAVRSILSDILNSDDRLIKEPAPVVTLNDANAGSITFGLYAHVKGAEMGTVQSALIEKIKITLHSKGIWV